MNSLTLCKNAGQIYLAVAKRFVALSANRYSINDIIDSPEKLELASLNYERRRNDPFDIKKARLLYQSRKRGMLENGIILSTFAAKYLSKMNEKQVDEYDKIINLPSNDWDIFYWAMEMRPIPKEFDNSVMQMIKEHIKKSVREVSTNAQPSIGKD